MTVGELLFYIGEHPMSVVAYYGIILLIILISGVIGKGELDLSPWPYLYSALIFAICIPGIFALVLVVYQLIFRNQDLLDVNVWSEIVPILALFTFLPLINRQLPFNKIPGFGRVSGLITLISVSMAILWLLDRTHIIAFTYIPVTYLLLFIVGLALIARWGMLRFIR